MSNERVIREISADYEAREAQVERRTRSPFGWKSRDVELSLLASAPQTRAPSVPGMLRHRGDWHRVHVEHRNSWNQQNPGTAFYRRFHAIPGTFRLSTRSIHDSARCTIRDKWRRRTYMRPTTGCLESIEVDGNVVAKISVSMYHLRYLEAGCYQL